MGDRLNHSAFPEFSGHELEVMTDLHFLQTKNRVTEKVRLLLEEVCREIQSSLSEATEKNKLAEIAFSRPKISRGEQYRGLPYQVLDYPAAFSNEDIFTFRTMFWWGHHFSVTLHLQGKYLENHLADLKANFDLLLDKNIYISTGDTPWEYHYEPDNYKLLSSEDKSFMEKRAFLKLSSQIALKDWQRLPGRVLAFFELMLQVLGAKEGS